MSAIPGAVPTPAPVSTTDVVKTGKVTAVNGKDRVTITYTAGGKVQRKTVNKVNHGFKKNQTVFVVHKRTAPYAFVSVSATRPTIVPAPSPVPTPVPVPVPVPTGTLVKTGKVAAVVNKDKVTITYTAGGKVQRKTVNKVNHGFKKNQNVFVVHKSAAPYAFVSVSATRPAATPAPVPTPVPVPVPVAGGNVVKTARVAYVKDAVVTVNYMAGGTPQQKTITKPNNGFVKGQDVFVVHTPAAPFDVVSVSATKP